MTVTATLRADETERIGARLLVLLAAYFAVQAVLRTLYASSLGLDEAEMVVLSQSFEAGYGSQPPLYTWIQIPVFALFGENTFALAIVKNAFLFASFAFAFLAARLVLGDNVKAAATTLALFTIPQLGWESQRALSHTVIVVTFAAVTLYVFLLLMRSGRPLHYALFGACLGLGAMTKYNYAVFAAALLLAGLTLPAFRARILSSWMLLSAALALLLLAPHLAWLAGHSEAALSRVEKFEIATDGGLSARMSGLVGAAQAVFNFAIVPVIILLAIAFLPIRNSRETMSAKPGGWEDGKRLIPRLVIAGLVLILALVLATGANEVRDRWLQPLFFILPLALFILLEGRMNAARQRSLTILSAVFALTFMIGLAAAHLLPDLFGRTARASVPYGPIAEEFRRLGFERGYILSPGSYVAGNLKLRFPDSTVGQTEYGLWPPASPPEALLLAWDSHEEAPPEALLALRRTLCGEAGEPLPAPIAIGAPYEHSQTQTYTLKVVLTPMCTPFRAGPR